MAGIMSNLIGEFPAGETVSPDRVHTDRVMCNQDQILDDTAEIKGMIAEIKGMIKGLRQRFSWEEKASDSGIQIAAGPTTVTRYGFLMSVCSVPTPQGIVFAFVLQDEVTNKFAILSPDLVKSAPL
jgi:hypothetical protein